MKVSGRAIRVTEAAEFARYRQGGEEPAHEAGMVLFRVELTRASLVSPEGDHLVIQWWQPGQGVRPIERR